ncbi:MAG TPA: hypothetical protein GXZ20_04830 [Halanaerobiaceae bacterium]|jgi:hypothetical protein|nr:hypothetical protein [Bacillota bacterium]HHU92442.1 hypothetical protein [Halanaerobiaceae bacterium]HOA40540.1 hypothetical protein [Halanaerobiales bacterium]HPZ62734.1 hypothetical protein [Halanaerobiales bacterium]HQD04055.1 hypothetical protein [Halanaerobiales bacterium]
MPVRTKRGFRQKKSSFLKRYDQLQGRRRIRAEVFEDLATESIVELQVYETFLDLNPQVREFPNLGPDDQIIRDEEI